MATEQVFSRDPRQTDDHYGYTLHLMEVHEPNAHEEGANVLAARIARDGRIPTLVRLIHADNSISYHIYGLSKKGTHALIRIEGIAQENLDALNALDFSADHIKTSPRQNPNIYKAIISTPSDQTLPRHPRESDEDYNARLDRLIDRAGDHHAFLHSLLEQHTQPLIKAYKLSKQDKRDEAIYDALLTLGSELNNYFVAKQISPAEATQLAPSIGKHSLFHDTIASLSPYAGIIRIVHRLAGLHSRTNTKTTPVSGEETTIPSPDTSSPETTVAHFFSLVAGFLKNLKKPITNQDETEHFKDLLKEYTYLIHFDDEMELVEAPSLELIENTLVAHGNALLNIIEDESTTKREHDRRIVEASIEFSRILPDVGATLAIARAYAKCAPTDDILMLACSERVQTMLKNLRPHKAIFEHLNHAFEEFYLDLPEETKTSNGVETLRKLGRHIALMENLLETPEWHEEFSSSFRSLLAGKENIRLTSQIHASPEKEVQLTQSFWDTQQPQHAPESDKETNPEDEKLSFRRQFSP